MKSHRIIQCSVYSIAAVSLGLAALASIMVGVWGVRISPLLYLALLSSAALMAGAVTSLINAPRGRMIALCALAGIGTVWVPSAASLVPQYNTSTSSVGYLIFSAYFAVAAFVLFFPNRWRFSTATFVLLCFVTASVAAATYVTRLRQGEYARPAFAYFHWRSEPTNSLVVTSDSDAWIDNNVKKLLEHSGLHGTLEWSGSSGERSSPNRVIVLAQAKPTDNAQLHYPRQGSLVYAYDGSHWLKLPADASTFPAFATLESDASSSMLYEDVGGGRQGTFAFRW